MCGLLVFRLFKGNDSLYLANLHVIGKVIYCMLFECAELNADMKDTCLVYMDLITDRYLCKTLYFLHGVSKDVPDVQLLLNLLGVLMMGC